MKLVIEIPEEYRSIFEENRCEEKFDSLCTNEFGYVLRKAFENGTPIPKGHGRLIDADKAKETMMYEMCGTGYQGRAMRVLDSEFYTPTIIEQDGDSE